MHLNQATFIFEHAQEYNSNDKRIGKKHYVAYKVMLVVYHMRKVHPDDELTLLGRNRELNSLGLRYFYGL